MTDQQIISAVLTSCGWKKLDNYPKGRCWWEPRYGNCVIQPPILTSLDACKKVFEKDAPDEYWDYVVKENIGWKMSNHEQKLAIAKATPHQRCLAWLKFKGVEGV